MDPYFYGLVKFLIVLGVVRPRLWALFEYRDDDDDDDELFDLASQKQHTFCGERDADRKRAWRDIASKKKKRSLAVGVPFSELLLRVFFVVSSERFLKGTFTLLKRCSRGLLGETRGKNARYSDTRTYLRRTQSVRW